MKTFNPFYILSVLIILALTLPSLLGEGMFMDAVQYTAVAKNLSQGYGTFWFPQFSVHNPGGLDSFHEQPPLVFGIQAILFKLLGSGWFVERLYVLLTILANYILMINIWKLFKNQLPNSLAWLPPILWISIPVCFWSYGNNMHENTMSIFTLLAVYLYILAIIKGHSYFIFLSGISVFCASFSKGLPGLFPVIAPILFAFFQRKNYKHGILHSLLLLAIVLLIYIVLIYVSKSAQESLKLHFIDRALTRINLNEYHTVNSRFYIVYRLFSELLVPLLLTSAVLLIGRRKINLTSAHKRLAIFFFVLGVCGSFPLLLTKVQKGFYFVASLPFFALGFSVLMSNVMEAWMKKLSVSSIHKIRRLVITVMGLIILALPFFYRSRYNRDKEMLQDVYALGKMVDSKTRIGAAPDILNNNWSLVAYLVRYEDIYCVYPHEPHTFYIGPQQEMDHYKKVVQLNTFNVFEKLP